MADKSETVAVERSFPGSSYNWVPVPAIELKRLDSRTPNIDPGPASVQRPTSDQEQRAGRFLWNARQLANRLPEDLVVDILMRLPSHSARDTEASNEAGWFPLMLLCRRWRAIVVANACFWRIIFVGESIRWLKLVLPRCGDAALRLRFGRRETLIAALPELLPIRHRIERLDLGNIQLSSCALVLASEFLSTPLVSVQALTMSGGGSAHDGGVEFRPDRFPGLVKLELKHARLTWDAAFLYRLRSLDLTGCRLTLSTISINTFFEVLKAGRNLEELTLHEFLSAACPSPCQPVHHWQATPTVCLPRLRKLFVSDGLPWIPLLVTRLQLPSQGQVCLTGLVEWTDLQGDVYEALLPQDLDGLPLRATTGAHLVILESIYWIVCEVPGPLTVTVHLRARSAQVPWVQSPNTGLTHFSRLLGAAPGLTELSLQLDLSHVAQDVLDATLDAFPRLRKLRVTSSVYGPDPFPIVLCASLRARSATRSGGVGGVRCACLEVLRVERVRWEDGAFMNAVADCLRERAERGAPRLELLALTASRSREHDWSAADARFASVLRPMVEVYEFVEHGW